MNIKLGREKRKNVIIGKELYILQFYALIKAMGRSAFHCLFGMTKFFQNKTLTKNFVILQRSWRQEQHSEVNGNEPAARALPSPGSRRYFISHRDWLRDGQVPTVSVRKQEWLHACHG
jgi:hypothetical protein